MFNNDAMNVDALQNILRELQKISGLLYEIKIGLDLPPPSPKRYSAMIAGPSRTDSYRDRV